MSKTIGRIHFLNVPCRIELHQYANKRHALELITEDDFEELMCRATVNLPEVPLADDEVIIKDWNENAGTLLLLEGAGIVSRPLRYVRTGYVKAPVCKLLVGL